jgi:hypothetical protein
MILCTEIFRFIPSFIPASKEVTLEPQSETGNLEAEKSLWLADDEHASPKSRKYEISKAADIKRRIWML